MRVLAAVAEGATRREAAARFCVSAASVSRWRSLAREQGDFWPGASSGDRCSGRIEAQPALVLLLLDEMNYAIIVELRQAEARVGHEILHLMWVGTYSGLGAQPPRRGRQGCAQRARVTFYKKISLVIF